MIALSHKMVLMPEIKQQQQYIQLLVMFVKQAYEKRLKRQEQDLPKLTNTKKAKQPAIGSIKNDKVNYDKQQQFFSKEDIPQHAKNIKEEINRLIDPDHLGLRKQDWNLSVSVPNCFQKEQTHQQKLLKIKLGFLDHPLPKYKEARIWTGTETREDYTKWNVSIQPIIKQVKQNLLKKTQTAFDNSKLREVQFLSTYTNPLARTTHFIEAGKQKLKSEGEMRQQLRENYIFQNPMASEEKISGAVFRLAYETAVKQKKDEVEAQAMKTDFKANLTLTQQSRISLEFTHNGIWQRCTPELAGQQAFYSWSCCRSEERASRGCTHTFRDKNKWNLVSFNNS